MPEPVPASVVGLDLSLRSAGFADAEGKTFTVKAEGNDYECMGIIRSTVMEILPYRVELVMIEAPIAYLKGESMLRLAGLAAVVRQALYDDGVPFLDVQPATLKIYATGKGSAGKYEVIRAAEKRLGYEGLSDDEADALWLRAMGADLLGVPVTYLPDHHRRALNTLKDIAPTRRSS